MFKPIISTKQDSVIDFSSPATYLGCFLYQLG